MRHLLYSSSHRDVAQMVERLVWGRGAVRSQKFGFEPTRRAWRCLAKPNRQALASGLIANPEEEAAGVVTSESKNKQLVGT